MLTQRFVGSVVGKNIGSRDPKKLPTDVFTYYSYYKRTVINHGATVWA